MRHRITYQNSAGLDPAYSTLELASTACSPVISINPFIAYGSIPGSAHGTPKTPNIGAPLSAFFESATSDQCSHTLSYSMLLLLTLASGGVSECEIPSREIMLS